MHRVLVRFSICFVISYSEAFVVCACWNVLMQMEFITSVYGIKMCVL